MFRKVEWLRSSDIPLDYNGPVGVEFEPLHAWIDPDPISRFSNVALRFPDKLAVCDADLMLTYAELETAVDSLARRIAETISPREPIVALLPGGVPFAVALLAAFKSNNPLIPIDASHPVARQSAVFQNAGAAAILVLAGSESNAEFVPAGMPLIPIGMDRHDGKIFEVSGASPDDIAGVGYTSGSTGRPKGYAFARRAALALTSDFVESCHLNPDDRLIALSSMSASGLRDILATVVSGATLYIVNPKRAGMGEVLRVIHDERITVLSFVPTFVRTLMQLPEARGMVQTLRILELSGEPTLGRDISLYRSKLAASCHIRCCMGSTETMRLFCWFVPAAEFPEAEAIPCGYLLPGRSIALLDESGRSVEAEEVGQLVVRAPYLAAGIWQQGKVLAGPFVRDPDDPKSRVFHSNDLMRLDKAGLGRLIGRGDREVKIRGLRADLAEIEEALRTVTGVADAAVIARDDGETPVLAAFFVGAEGSAAPNAGALRTKLAEDLPPHMIPTEIIRLQAMPRLPNFKVDLQTLRTLNRQKNEQLDSFTQSTHNPVEDAVAEAWVAALGWRAFSANLPFDHAGGDSLKILSVVFHVERILSRKLPLEIVRTAMTPRDLIGEIERLDGWSSAALDDRPLVFMVVAKSSDEQRLATLRDVLSGWFRFETVIVPAVATHQSHAGADEVIARINGLQPFDAAHLLGYGTAAIPALAAARHLAERRSRPGLVGLIDPELGRGAAHLQSAVPEEGGKLAERESRIEVFTGTGCETLLSDIAIPGFARSAFTLHEIEARGGSIIEPPAVDRLCAKIVQAFVTSEIT